MGEEARVDPLGGVQGLVTCCLSLASGERGSFCSVGRKGLILKVGGSCSTGPRAPPVASVWLGNLERGLCAATDHSENSLTESCTDRYGCQLENNNFTEMCSGSEAGAYSRLIGFVYRSTLGLKVINKRGSDGDLDRAASTGLKNSPEVDGLSSG